MKPIGKEQILPRIKYFSNRDSIIIKKEGIGMKASEEREYCVEIASRRFAKDFEQWGIFSKSLVLTFLKGFRENRNYIGEQRVLLSEKQKVSEYFSPKEVISLQILNSLVTFNDKYLNYSKEGLKINYKKIKRGFVINNRDSEEIHQSLEWLNQEVVSDQPKQSIKDIWLIKNYLISFIKDEQTRVDYCKDYVIPEAEKAAKPLPTNLWNQPKNIFQKA